MDEDYAKYLQYEYEIEGSIVVYNDHKKLFDSSFVGPWDLKEIQPDGREVLYFFEDSDIHGNVGYFDIMDDNFESLRKHTDKYDSLNLELANKRARYFVYYIDSTNQAKFLDVLELN